MRLTELFATISWPVSEIDTSFPPSTTGAGLAAQAADAIEVDDVVTDVGADGTVTLTGTLSLVTGPGIARTRLVSHLFPSLGFTFVPNLDWTSAFRVSIGPAGGSTVQIDTLPLEVAVPPDLLRAHPDETRRGADEGLTLAEGAGDSLIKRDFSFLMDADAMIHLEPHLPISVGPCCIFGTPATAVHEITLIAAPAQARDQVDWLRRDLDQSLVAFNGGSLGLGGIELDFEQEGTALHDLRNRIHLSEHAQVVLEDLVLPSVLLPPVPQHGTIGVRRSLEPGESIDHFLSFADAPIVVPLGRDANLFLSQLFFVTPEQGADWWTGLTIEGGVAWADGGAPDHGNFELSIGLIDGDVLQLGFLHTPAGSHIPLLHLDLWKITVDFTGLKAGVSLQEVMRSSPDPGAALRLLTTIVIKEKPGDGAGAAGAVRVTTEDGRPFEAALVDVGWDRGKPSGNMIMPGGAQLHLSTFVLEVHEMGLAYEHGATYISISGGIRLGVGTFEGGVWFTRLRGKLGGNPDAPGFQLGGIGLEIKVKNVVEISAHGMYRDETSPDGTRLQEQGLGGGIVIYAGGNKWGLTLDLYWGTRTPPGGPGDEFFLFLLAFFGAIPMGPVELTGIEVLFAYGLMPKIEAGDRQAGELKYYSWLKRARPTALPETRDLDSSWKPTKDAWAFGLGVGVSITGAGSVIKLTAFGAGFDSPTAAGLIIVIEVSLFGADKPLALGVFEYDFRRDAFVLIIQLDITLQDIIENFPENLDVRLGGTITIGNKPGLVAIGRLADQSTWIGGKLEVDLSEIFTLTLRAGFCVEWQENSHVGGGLLISLKIVGSIGVLEFQGWGALEILVTYMLTGTNDFVARIRFEAGMAIVLFGFIRFGISIELLAEWLAHVPNYFVFRVTFRFETPWFLPDISYSIEVTRGTLVPSARGVTTSPLSQAGGQALTGSTPTRVQRADGREGGEPTALASVDSLTGATGAWQGGTAPVALDATIEIDFSVMLVDALAIGATNPDLGLQVSGDGDLALTSRYSLVHLTMRRRPLSGGPWTTVEDLTSASAPRSFRWAWDQDSRVGGQVAPKRLLLNGRTPFTVGVDNPLADAEILTDNPAYPCCQVRRPDVARFDFDPEPRGPLPAGFVRDLRYEDRGTTAPVRVHGAACAVVLPTAAGATSGRVGSFAANGTIATVSASEDLAAAVVRIAVSSTDKVRLVLVVLNRDGRQVDRQQVSSGPAGFQEFAIIPGAPFATVLLGAETLGREENQPAPKAPGTVLLDAVECITVADRDRFDRESEICSRESTAGTPPTVTFLARHDYEIALTTEVAVKHSATEWESSTVTEKVAFTTAGPPGLNAAPEPGLELEPYVVSRAPGGRGLTYREESVHLVLSEALSIFGPGSGSTEAQLRLPVTIAIESAFDANSQAHVGKTSRTTADWFLTHRGETDPLVGHATLDYLEATSRDAGIRRYLQLAQASSGTCPVQDLEQLPRVGVEPFDPSGRSLWEPSAAYVAVMRLAGSPVVERAAFENADLGAFAAVSGAWQVADGVLEAVGTCTGTFGDADWDLYKIDLRGTVDPGGELGVQVVVGGSDADTVHAAVVLAPNGSGSLVVRSGTGAALGTAPLAEVGQRRALTVEVFADLVRARCGDAVLDVPRGSRGAGRCRLVATDAHLTSLRVHGVDMYPRPFRTSRYEGFAEHIASCTGVERYDAGSAAEPLATLLARVGGAVAAAMLPGAPGADRERCFADAASALAVPLREDSDRLHVTLVSGGSDRWVLLESPEPMDFTEEITLGLLRQVVHEALTAADKTRLGPLIEAALQGPIDPRDPFGRIPGVRALMVPARRPGILDLPGARKAVYQASLEGKYLVVVKLDTRTKVKVKAPVLTPVDRALLEGVTVDLNAAIRIIRWRVPTTSEWVPQSVAVLQDAPGSHALMLPAAPLAGGTYRVVLSMTRRWFETVDPLGPDNAYLDEAWLELLVP